MSGLQLQQILGTDKRNPVFTLARDTSSRLLHLYYGGELLEVVPDDRNAPAFKLLVGRLLNANVSAVKLHEAFGADYKTMRRWGRALKSSDAETLVRVLEGRQAGRKLSTSVRSFVRFRFPSVYPENPRSYSGVIRKEIADVYDGLELSGETLRPLFKELKETFKQKAAQEDQAEPTACLNSMPWPPARPDARPEPLLLTGKCEGDAAPREEASKRETPCDKPEGDLCTETPLLLDIEPDMPAATPSADRKGSPCSGQGMGQFVHHLGVLLFSAALIQVEGLLEKGGSLIKQWLASILLGMANIEQSKLLDFDSLGLITGASLRSRHPQRQRLQELANTDWADELLCMNGQVVGIADCTDFYFDPHTKHCTGQPKLLKGWCANRHFADKVLHMDFIHTAQGNPVYVQYADNFEDLRERFIKTTEDFRLRLGLDAHIDLTFVIDRGIFGQEKFVEITAYKHLHIITWLKDYKPVPWDEEKVEGTVLIERPRNRAQDVEVYSFEYMEEEYVKVKDMRLVRVQASNPGGWTIQLGVLTDDPNRPCEDILRLMFNRWLQENDFKYLGKHFGLDQITSYASIPYKKLRDQVTDKETKSGEYKALEKQRKTVRAELKTLLFYEHQKPGASEKRTEKIKKLTEEDETISKQLQDTQKNVSRLELLIEQSYCRLDTSRKRLMDAIKLLARNLFYRELQPFKKAYDNFRDDHTIFRNLTHAHGLLIEHRDCVEVQLFPTAHYTPALRKIVQKLLAQINQNDPVLPDGSGKALVFALGEKKGIKLAHQKTQNGRI